MSDDKPKKSKSFLAKYDVESVPLAPWFKEPEKIVAAALKDDPNRRKALLDGLKELAEKDKEFRIHVSEILRELAKGKKGQRLSRPRYIDEWIFDHVNWILKLEKAKSQNKAFEQTAIFFNRSESSIRSIYFAVKKSRGTSKSTNR